jgi:NAD(P)-dependent dehydrogenase (short-subunit alcohol dehydrogenase family)
MAPKEPLKVPSFASFTSTWHGSPYDHISPSRSELSAAGRTVVVTGGGTGIGKAIAKAFAQAGASSVAILGRREDRLRAAIKEISDAVPGTKPRLIFKVADLNDREVVKQALKEISEEQNSKIDVLVPNAGDLVHPAPISTTEVDDFMKAFDYNVRLPLNTVLAFLPYSAKHAVILNISSGIAHMDPVPGLSAHGASKAAGVKLLDYIQAEHPNFHIVNIQPGSVETEMSHKAGRTGKDDRKSHLILMLCY